MLFTFQPVTVFLCEFYITIYINRAEKKESENSTQTKRVVEKQSTTSENNKSKILLTYTYKIQS